MNINLGSFLKMNFIVHKLYLFQMENLTIRKFNHIQRILVLKKIDEIEDCEQEAVNIVSEMKEYFDKGIPTIFVIYAKGKTKYQGERNYNGIAPCLLRLFNDNKKIEKLILHIYGYIHYKNVYKPTKAQILRSIANRNICVDLLAFERFSLHKEEFLKIRTKLLSNQSSS